MAEYFSEAPQFVYTNEDMQRGVELEEQARSLYELTHDVVVDTVGFVELNDYVGCSPDGLVGDDGGIEIKCKNDVNYFKNLLEPESIESKYLWQIQMCLLITGRKWWDYVAYNPNFQKSMITVRITPDEEKFEMLREGFKSGEKRIKELMSAYEAV